MIRFKSMWGKRAKMSDKRVWPISTLPEEPAECLKMLQELRKLNVISNSEYQELLKFPGAK